MTRSSEDADLLQCDSAVCCAVVVQVTDESHVDKPYLVVAVTAMTEVAAAINEFKRRKDLGAFHSVVVIPVHLYFWVVNWESDWLSSFDTIQVLNIDMSDVQKLEMKHAYNQQNTTDIVKTHAATSCTSRK